MANDKKNKKNKKSKETQSCTDTKKCLTNENDNGESESNENTSDKTETNSVETESKKNQQGIASEKVTHNEDSFQIDTKDNPANEDAKNESESNENTSDKTEKTETNSKIKNSVSSIITGVVIELVVLVIVALFGWFSGFLKLPKTVSTIETKIDTHIETQEKFNEKISDRVDRLYSSRVSQIERAIVLNTDVINIWELFEASYNDDVSMSSPSVKEDSVLYRDDEIEFWAKDLIDKKIIIPYIEDGKDIFFCGQFDNDFKWDGECLINVYSNNQLVLATLEKYSHGIRTEYEQIFSEKGNWIYSKRESSNDVNTGDTWIYNGIEGFSQIVSDDDPVEEELIFPDIIKSDINGKLISRYHGNTSEGHYNDSTGNAYLIQFDSEGIVRTLYHGNFKDGKFDSESMHSWYITRNPETKTNYMYYMGKFSDGNPYSVESEECAYFENPLTRSTFNRVMSGREYDCVMLWAEECIVSNNE